MTLAQTIAQQPNWWSKFSGTETVKPKALSFTSKSNVYSNKLPQWGTKLHPFEWLALTGMDRASVGIMLSVAVMQITKSGELDERAAMEQCAGLLLHIQYIARFCTFHEAEADGGPVLSPITVLDTAADEWPGNSRWATTRTDATAVPLEPESVENLPSITFSIDHQSAEELLAAHTNGSVKILSPQKRRAGFTVSPHPPSPSPFRGPSSRPTAQLPSPPGEGIPSTTTIVPAVTAVPPVNAVPPGLPMSSLPSPSSRSPPKPTPPSSPLSELPEEDGGDTIGLSERESAIWFRF